VLYEQPRDRSPARECAAFASPAMVFTPQGLMLGAGTIVVPTEGIRRLKSLKSGEQQVLALSCLQRGGSAPPFSAILNAPSNPGARATTSPLTFIWRIRGCIS
jgi:hypothetical protein